MYVRAEKPVGLMAEDWTTLRSPMLLNAPMYMLLWSPRTTAPYLCKAAISSEHEVRANARGGAVLRHGAPSAASRCGAYQTDELSLISTLPMTEAFGATKVAAPSAGRWS